MAENALTRTARALDLVPFVIENPGISIEDLAKEFDTTSEQMVKDLEMIFMCGLPGYTTLDLIDLTFDDGYVSVIDPQVLNHPRKLSRNEVLTLLLSLESLASLRNESDSLVSTIRNLQSKLRSVINSPLNEIPVIARGGVQSQFLPVVEKALTQGSGVEISYVSATSDKESVRTILPEEIFSENGYVYVKAWCFLTESSRTFRVDRIKSAKLVTLIELPAKPANNQSEEYEIRLFVKSAARHFYDQNFRICTVINESPEGVEILITLQDTEWLSRTLLGLGGNVSILAPASLAEAMVKRAEAALSMYAQHA